jgi:GABA(A) receptor-associated protein
MSKSCVRGQSFKQDRNLEYRKTVAAEIKKLHPDRCPVVVEKSVEFGSIPSVEYKKFLVPSELTIAKFITEVRKYFGIDDASGIFFFIENKYSLISSGESIFSIYDKYKNEDGFLYLTCFKEKSFGDKDQSGN